MFLYHLEQRCAYIACFLGLQHSQQASVFVIVVLVLPYRASISWTGIPRPHYIQCCSYTHRRHSVWITQNMEKKIGEHGFQKVSVKFWVLFYVIFTSSIRMTASFVPCLCSVKIRSAFHDCRIQWSSDICIGAYCRTYHSLCSDLTHQCLSTLKLRPNRRRFFRTQVE